MKRDSGITLLEAAAACTLLALLSTQAFATLRGMQQQYALQRAGQTLLGAALEARTLALSRNLAVGLEVDSTGCCFATFCGPDRARRWQKLPDGVFFARAPTRPVTFYSRGYASPAGTFTLSSPAGSFSVVVSVSGRIRWEREN